MAEGFKDKSLLDLPPSERPIDFQHISYARIAKKTESSTEIIVRLTLNFGKRNPREFSGEIKYAHSKAEESISEAESFINAAQDVWKEYRLREERRVNFVRDFLTKKWGKLEGEKLTGLKVHFDNDSDDIICGDCPKKPNRSKS